MNDFDPFGGSDYKAYDNNNPSKKKININFKKYLPLVIKIVIGLIIFYFLIYTLFLNKTTINFEVKDTEGALINNARINIDGEFYASNENIKLKKKTYNVSISASGEYINKTMSIDLKNEESSYISVTLEKDIRLKIEDAVIDAANNLVFPNQTIYATISVTNIHDSRNYTAEDISIKGITNYEYLNVNSEPREKNEIVFLAGKKTTFKIKFIVPEDSKLEEKNITFGIKYRTNDSTTSKTVKYQIIATPNINIDLKLTNEEIESGNYKNITYSINNKNNDLSIRDLSVSIDVNSLVNENVKNWFTFDENPLVNPKTEVKPTIRINVPANAYEDEIKGVFVFDSIYFLEPKIIDFSIKINEPEINFDTKINSENINLTYDSTTQKTDSKIIELTLTNNSKLNITILDYVIEEVIGGDCNNFINMPISLINTVMASRSEKQDFEISLINKDLFNETEDVIRSCRLKIIYQHPFKDENIEINENFKINININ